MTDAAKTTTSRKGGSRSATTVPSSSPAHNHDDATVCTPPCPAYRQAAADVAAAVPTLTEDERSARIAANAEAERVAFPPVPAFSPLPVDSLAEALVAFQGEMPHVPKTQTARIPGKDGRQGYSYEYADLGDVSDAATPLLVKHGLAFTCLPTRTESGSYELAGVLLHASSGEELRGALPIMGRTAQEIGSSITYGRRYLLGCMTGIITDADEDGAAANQAPPTQEEPSFTAAQYRLHQAIDRLDQTQRADLILWWTGQGLPPLATLADEHVAKVEGRIQEMTTPDPTQAH